MKKAGTAKPRPKSCSNTDTSSVTTPRITARHPMGQARNKMKPRKWGRRASSLTSGEASSACYYLKDRRPGPSRSSCTLWRALRLFCDDRNVVDPKDVCPGPTLSCLDDFEFVERLGFIVAVTLWLPSAFLAIFRVLLLSSQHSARPGPRFRCRPHRCAARGGGVL